LEDVGSYGPDSFGRVEMFIAIKIKVVAFWVVTPCSDVAQRFGFYDSGQGPVVGSCGNGNKTSASRKDGEFLE
jgi:hypothetical protein